MGVYICYVCTCAHGVDSYVLPRMQTGQNVVESVLSLCLLFEAWSFLVFLLLCCLCTPADLPKVASNSVFSSYFMEGTRDAFHWIGLFILISLHVFLGSRDWTWVSKPLRQVYSPTAPCKWCHLGLFFSFIKFIFFLRKGPWSHDSKNLNVLSKIPLLRLLQ